MLCVPWWTLVVIVVAATALGFVLYFVWHWWLLSRPDVRR
jgi:hypothetical protein